MGIGKSRKPKFRCKSEAQKFAIRASYAKIGKRNNPAPKSGVDKAAKKAELAAVKKAEKETKEAYEVRRKSELEVAEQVVKGSKEANVIKDDISVSTETEVESSKTVSYRDRFPKEFPFWARLKIYKNRTSLVIDEKRGIDEKTKKETDLFVHREATHTKGRGELIEPNPDKTDPDPMYLKSPRVLPQIFFYPHNKELDMPETLRMRYEKNNHQDSDKNE